jgi:hypothetical protein
MSFSMTVRYNASHGSLRRQRVSRARPPGEGQAPATQPAVSAAPPRNLRHGGPCQDRALYSCGCGYAFDAPVSTSVDCPHCGDRQAW